MKPEELKLAQDSLILIRPMADQIAKSFYLHLFEIAPRTMRLFTGDMDRQGIMLMTSLDLAVQGLGDMESVMPSVHALGERHYSYGVKPEYYQSAVESFVWSLEQHLGDQFTAELREAWRMAFQALADAMLSVYDAQ